MHSNETTIVSKDGTLHRFCYDYSFWSFDQLQNHASQNTVYEELARPLLDKAFEGYNTCLFAYGQVSEREMYILSCPSSDFLKKFIAKTIFCEQNSEVFCLISGDLYVHL